MRLSKLGTWKGAYPSERIQSLPAFDLTFCSLLRATAIELIMSGVTTDAEQETLRFASELFIYCKNYETIITDVQVVVSSLMGLKTAIGYKPKMDLE